MKKLVAFVLLGMCCFILTPQAWAEEVTRQLPFTTKVTLAVPKTYLFKMELCTDAMCTDQAYAETQKIVLKTATLSFKLGAGTVWPTSPTFSEVDFSQQYWLRISRSTATGFAALGPPSKLSVVPYALWSNQVEGGAGIGTITGVVAGNGLSGGAATGIATLSVGAGSGIEVGADTVSIAAGGVTSAHIGDGAVASADILDGAVTSADIANGTVGSADIATGGVTSANILDGTVTSADIGTGGVTSANILDGAVTGADILDNSVAVADVGFGFAGSTAKGGAALDSDAVDGKHAINLRPIFSSSNSSSGAYIQTTCTNGSSISITVPSAGRIVVEFDAQVYLSHFVNTRDFGYLMVGTGNSDCNTSYYYRAIFDVPATYGNNSNYIQLHNKYVYSVSAGTYTYYLNGYMSSGAGNDSFGYLNMTAVFYPN